MSAYSRNVTARSNTEVQTLSFFLSSKDQVQVKFTALGAQFASLLEENRRLNEELNMTTEQEEAKLTSRKEALSQVKVLASEQASPLKDLQEKNLEAEIDRLQSKTQSLALKIENHLQNKVLQLKEQIHKERERQNQERPGLEKLEKESAEWTGKQAAAEITEKKALEKLVSTKKKKAELIENYRQLADRIISLAQEEINRLSSYIPAKPPHIKTPEYCLQDSQYAHLSRLKSSLEQIPGFFGVMRNDRFS